MGSCDDRRLHLHYIIVFVADKVLVDGEPSDIGYVLPHVTCSSLVLWTWTFSLFLHAALEIDCMFWRGAKFQQHIIRQVNRYGCTISGTQFGHHFILWEWRAVIFSPETEIRQHEHEPDWMSGLIKKIKVTLLAKGHFGFKQALTECCHKKNAQLSFFNKKMLNCGSIYFWENGLSTWKLSRHNLSFFLLK